jgi:hypothetical protein
MEFFSKIYFSFPVQLLLLQVRKHQILLLFWLLLFAFINQSIGQKFGIPYLFLDPEYINEVSIYSFFIIGLAVGGFCMIWNMTNYILHAWRFNFLAAVKEPFIKFCLNNSIVPIVFIINYCYNIYQFQIAFETKDSFTHFLFIEVFLAGFFVIIAFTLVYFFSTNKSILKLMSSAKDKKSKMRPFLYRMRKDDLEDMGIKVSQRVDNYWDTIFSFKATNKITNYSSYIIDKVFRQHFGNILFIQVSTMMLLVILGSFNNISILKMPAGANIVLLFAVITILVGAFSYLLRGWRITAFIGLVLIFNLLSSFDWFSFKNKAYGLKYGIDIPYSNNDIASYSTPETELVEKQLAISNLNNWLKRQPISCNQKPKLLLLNVSGGGSRSALWTFMVMNYLDSILDKKLLIHTKLIAGASGGMMGAAYYRELVYQNRIRNNCVQCNAKEQSNIATDFLNSVTSAITLNDMFVNWKTFKYANQTYQIDRGYAFEQQLMLNTNNLLNKKLVDYSLPEQAAILPQVIINGTILNDGRTLMMSALPVAYLGRSMIEKNKVDAIDFRKYFKDVQADSLLFTSAIRINCTFPYILPTVSLPTQPNIEVMDAGVRDNYGIETSVKYLFNMAQWVNENTSGVVIIQIADINRDEKAIEGIKQNTITKTFNPVTNVFYNFPEFQYYHNHNSLNLLSGNLSVPLNFYNLAYSATGNNKRASLSFHLTTNEKKSIKNALFEAQNQVTFLNIERLFCTQ